MVGCTSGGNGFGWLCGCAFVCSNLVVMVKEVDFDQLWWLWRWDCGGDGGGC